MRIEIQRTWINRVAQYITCTHITSVLQHTLSIYKILYINLLGTEEIFRRLTRRFLNCGGFLKHFLKMKSSIYR